VWHPRNSPAEDGRDRHANLAWLESDSGQQHFLNDVATIGRAPDSDIRLNSSIVSRYHALLRNAGDRWVLTDLDSTNGTTVNDHPITSTRSLHSGDIVAFGDVRFVFRQATDHLDGPPTVSERVVVPLHRTTHFRLFAAVGSFAEQHHEELGERIEQVWTALENLLGEIPQQRPIHVYLVEALADPTDTGRLEVGGGYADPGSLTIWEIYRPDSPGNDLERSLLTIAAHLSLDGRTLPTPVTVGLLLLIQRGAGNDTSREQVDLDVAEAAQQGLVPALPQLLTAGTGNPHLDALAIASLLNAILNAGGRQSIPRFLNELAVNDPNAAARHALGISLTTLEKRWRKRLSQTTSGGVRLFLRLLWPYLGLHRLKLAEIAAYLLLGVLFGIGLARAQGYLLDEALIPGDGRLLAIVMTMLVAAFLVVNVASIRENYLRAWVSERVLRDLRLRMFARVQDAHPGFFHRADSGDLLARMTNDLFMVEAALSTGLVESLRLTFMFVAAMITVFIIEWRLALVALIGAPLFYAIGRIFGPPVARASIERQTQAGAVAGAIHENLAAQSVVKLYGLEQFETERFDRRLESLFRVSMRMHVRAGFYNVFSGSLANVVELAVLGIGAWLVLGGNITVGTLFTFLFLVGLIIGPMQSVSNLFQLVQQATGSMQRVQELIAVEPELRDTPDSLTIRRLSDAIRLSHVTFTYDGSRPILNDVSLVIPAGSHVAVVGTSGSGKSTVLGLLARFYDPQRGSVSFDGVDVRKATIASVRGQIGMVFQDIVLFNASIRENIRLGNPSATDEQIEDAARAAELHELVTSWPDGYDTLVGERGSHLSGGQRQRVAVARAILRNPALLLLDEATSALDPATEAAITTTLGRIAVGRTTVSVTHRLASIVTADRIFVMEQGRLAEQGTHEELLQLAGIYARLWMEQNGTRKPGPSGIDSGSLQQIPLLSGLDRQSLTNLASLLIAEHHPPGHEIVSIGDIADRLYLIADGEVDVIVPDAAGTPRVVAVLGPGDYFGEIALLRDTRRTASVRARVPVLLYALMREDFFDVLQTSPYLRDVIDHTVQAREADLRERAGGA
jgi:ATP-binding cassette subfamily B protein